MPPLGRRVETPGWPNISDLMGNFLKKIPRKLLASAAIKIGAYARGLRYLEVEARNDHITNLNSKRAPPFFDMTEETELTANEDKKEDNHSAPMMKWNDFANGALPPLNSELIDFSMEIYAKLGDADALQVISSIDMTFTQLSGN